MKHAAVNNLSYRDALIQIRKQERATHHGSVTSLHQAQVTNQPTVITYTGSTVDQDTQCDLDTDSPAVVDIGSASADHVTPVTVDAATYVNKGNIQRGSDVITHSDLYQLLAVLIQVSQDRSVSRSNIIKTILNLVFKMIDKPHDDIRQAINQHYPSALTGSIKDVVESTAESGDRDICKTNSKPKTDLKNSKGQKHGTPTCVQ